MRTSLSYLVHGLSGIIVFSTLGKFLPKLPLKPIIILGFIFLGCSGVMFAFVTPTSSYWELPFFAMIANVLGVGFVMLPAQITALGDASDDDQGVVGAIYNVGLQVRMK
jgi:predicted MFS family arabinose efflux permease